MAAGGVYIYIYIQWLNFLVALPRRVISIGNLNKGFKERSLVVRPPLLNIVFPSVAVSLPCSRQIQPPGHGARATTRSPRIIHVATFHVASKSRDFATYPSLCLLFLRFSFSLLAGDVIAIPGGRRGGREEACFPAYRSCWNREQPD